MIMASQRGTNTPKQQASVENATLVLLKKFWKCIMRFCTLFIAVPSWHLSMNHKPSVYRITLLNKQRRPNLHRLMQILYLAHMSCSSGDTATENHKPAHLVQLILLYQL